MKIKSKKYLNFCSIFYLEDDYNKKIILNNKYKAYITS